MPLVTSCPACQTSFELTIDELDAYGGKVRCGTCQHVFNAKEHLEADEIQVGLESDTQSNQAALNAAFENLDLSESASTRVEPSFSFPAKTTDQEVQQPSLLEQLSQVDASNTNRVNDAEIVDDALVQSSIETAETPNSAFIIPPKLSSELPADAVVPSFLKDLHIKDDFQKPRSEGRSFGYMLLALLLTLGLVLQLAYQLRTTLASQYPWTRPWLEKGCALIGCKVALPQDITQLTIDDADMQEHLERDGVLLFSSTLINHSNVTQGLPIIELTLTNTDDEPVIRKSFKPQQYLAENKDSALGIAPQEELRIKMAMSADAPVAGFRVGLSY